MLSPRLAVTMSGMPSPLKSADSQRVRVEADGYDFLRLERAVAVAQQHAHGVVHSIGDDEVGLAVAVDVHHRERIAPPTRLGKSL